MNDLKIYAQNLESAAMEQIETLANATAFDGAKIRIMPDAHAGAGCVIGFTAELGDKVVPNLVGVDIGCGVIAQWLPIAHREMDERFFRTLDKIVHEVVPAGPSVHQSRRVRFDAMSDLRCFRSLKDTKRLERSIGTLGGGNHFVELDKSEMGCWLVVHTGSRNLGKQVAEHYQNLAIDMHRGDGNMLAEKQRIIDEYKEQGRKNEIQGAIERLYCEYRSKRPDVKPELCWLEGETAEDYLHDMFICQEYAEENRREIVRAVSNALGYEIGHLKYVESVHNYIEPGTNITRKGAISAKNGEAVVIPLNMASGCIIGTGKGNPDYNFSAPHGAGRAMSRRKAKETLSMDAYSDAMGGVYSTCVCPDTLDEAPSAYKRPDTIIESLSDTVDIVQVVKPVYSFKATK